MSEFHIVLLLHCVTIDMMEYSVDVRACDYDRAMI